MGTHRVASAAAAAAGSLSDWHPCGAGVKEGPCTPSGYYASSVGQVMSADECPQNSPGTSVPLKRKLLKTNVLQTTEISSRSPCLVIY